MKSAIHKDENAVAYLIFYILASMFIFGLSYAIISDVRDMITPMFTTLGVLGNEYNDADTLWTFDFLNFLLSFSIMFFVIGLIWFAKQMAQKPETPWQ
jgi:glucan phosphoethanolaminetransferase (alkaline phosphatase superfamily)